MMMIIIIIIIIIVHETATLPTANNTEKTQTKNP